MKTEPIFKIEDRPEWENDKLKLTFDPEHNEIRLKYSINSSILTETFIEKVKKLCIKKYMNYITEYNDEILPIKITGKVNLLRGNTVFNLKPALSMHKRFFHKLHIIVPLPTSKETLLNRLKAKGTYETNYTRAE